MIYIVRKHNEFEKVRDVTIGAYSTFEKAVEAIRSNLMETGYYEDAMAIDIPDSQTNPFEICTGLLACAIRFPFGPNSFGRFFEVKTMVLDGD